MGHSYPYLITANRNLSAPSYQAGRFPELFVIKAIAPPFYFQNAVYLLPGKKELSCCLILPITRKNPFINTFYCKYCSR